jgi:RNA-directed DNA polymerase
MPGKVRDIDNPSEQLKKVQKKILKYLLKPVNLPHFLFGGVSELSVNEHAAQHVGSACVVKMDVKSYYPSVTSRHVYFVWCHVLKCSPPVASLLTKLTTYNWHLPQGAPTSPALANLFLASIYEPVLEACSVKYILPTAWVDDLIFSGKDARLVMEPVRGVFASNGFKLSARKRIILTGRHSKVVTGIRLGDTRIRAQKDKLQDIRAAIHKLEIGHVERSQIEMYVANVKGRLGHIERICAHDAAYLKRRLGRVLSSFDLVPS